MIYNDGLNVMLAFGGVYAAGVFHWGVTESAVYGFVLSVFAALGGWLGGNLGDRIGTRRALQLSLSLMIVAAVISLGFAPDRMFFVLAYTPGKPVADLPLFRTAPELAYIATVMVIAVCLVATYANSRAMLARLAPEARVTEFFGQGRTERWRSTRSSRRPCITPNTWTTSLDLPEIEDIRKPPKDESTQVAVGHRV